MSASSAPFGTGLSPAPLAPRPRVKQTSPDKNVSYRCTTAAFTLPPVPVGLRPVVRTRPEAGPSMRFLFVGSHLCAPASFGPGLAALPLPSASSYPPSPEGGQCSCRGLAPHKLTPMPGVHQRLHLTGPRAAPPVKRSRWADKERR